MRHSLRVFPLLTAALLLVGCQSSPPKPSPPAAAVSGATPTAGQPTGQMVAPTVEFHVGQLDAATDLKSVNLNGKQLYVTPQPVLTRADLTRMAPLKNSKGAFFVQFYLNPQGAQKMATLIEQSAGKYFVLSVDGSVAAISPIGAPINEGVLTMPVDSQARAVALVNSMMLRPAAIR